MEIATTSQASIDNLCQLLREASVLQTSQYFDGTPVHIAPAPAERQLGQVLTRYITMVMVTCDDLRIVFKVHFNPEPIRVHRAAQGKKSDALSDKQLIDYMKELINQIGGRVCRVFDAHQIGMGMSIPLCTRGIYEIYADYSTRSGAITKFGDFWRLEGAFGHIYCSCYLELSADADFSQIRLEDEQVEEGELDFL